MKNKTLHLIPVGLSESPASEWLPHDVRQLASRLDYYIAENAKTARAFLKLIETQHTLQDITIHSLSNKTPAQEIQTWLNAIVRLWQTRAPMLSLKPTRWVSTSCRGSVRAQFS